MPPMSPATWSRCAASPRACRGWRCGSPADLQLAAMGGGDVGSGAPPASGPNGEEIPVGPNGQPLDPTQVGTGTNSTSLDGTQRSDRSIGVEGACAFRTNALIMSVRCPTPLAE